MLVVPATQFCDLFEALQFYHLVIDFGDWFQRDGSFGMRGSYYVLFVGREFWQRL